MPGVMNIYIYDLRGLNTLSENVIEMDCEKHGKKKSAIVCGHIANNNCHPLGFIENSSDPDDLQGWCYACEYLYQQEEEMTDVFKKFNNMSVVCIECYYKFKNMHSI